jgi:hypothetical protein
MMETRSLELEKGAAADTRFTNVAGGSNHTIGVRNTLVLLHAAYKDISCAIDAVAVGERNTKYKL